jgi:hypothetical protein
MIDLSESQLTATNGSDALAVKSSVMEAMHGRLNVSDALSARNLHT